MQIIAALSAYTQFTRDYVLHMKKGWCNDKGYTKIKEAQGK